MVKTLYFIRHGQAMHNPDVDIYGKDILTDKKYFDAKLTTEGILQCKEYVLDIESDVVFVSPLYRTLQTANLMFGKTGNKIMALENIRERFGVRPCDKRRSLSILRKDFPHIDFTNCEEGYDDPIWTVDHRETEVEIKDRIKNFLEWIKTREEDKIVIVTHQGFMLRLYKVLGLDYEAPNNCETIKLILK